LELETAFAFLVFELTFLLADLGKRLKTLSKYFWTPREKLS